MEGFASWQGRQQRSSRWEQQHGKYTGRAGMGMKAAVRRQKVAEDNTRSRVPPYARVAGINLLSQRDRTIRRMQKCA